MSEMNKEKEVLKDLIKKLHEDPDKNLAPVKEQFAKIVKELTPVDISMIEQELVDEGISPDAIMLMCDVHLDMFKKSIVDDEIDVKPWHPINILMEEHKDILNTLGNFRKSPDPAKAIMELGYYLRKVEKYFQKEENSLFPYLEKHEMVQPPKIMWKEHDQIRELRKKILEEKVEEDELKQFLVSVEEVFANHIYKEHKILFPSAIKLISDEEWNAIRKQFDEIGYFSYFPKPFSGKEEEDVHMEESEISLPSGILNGEQLKLMLNTLPVDITFVDEHDRVRYFSETKDRIFVRSRGIIGRKVQNCHPPKSVDTVQKILDDFKSGKRDEADFYLHLGDQYVYIKYFAVRSDDGRYKGTLEVTQDIAPIQKISGTKTLDDES
ncbi:MAG: DUF438 domain-containing protein [Thermotogota bacterium]|nr:DUF438 domain-containing protein [Thermotogota bacterium]